MAERIRSVRRSQVERRVPTTAKILLFILVAAIGYVLGAFNTQIISSVAPMFGIRVPTGNLDLSSLQKTYAELKANFDGTLDDTKLIEGANKGLVVAAGDEYTLYMNNAEVQAFDNDLSGNIGGGIGVELGLRSDKVTVLRVLKDNPAEKAAVMVGDVVVSINGETADWTVEEAVSKIRGEEGTTVKLTVLRGTETKEFTITRATISNPSVYSSIQDGIGIMTITRFDSETGSLARATADSFKNKGVKAVILDLRGNGGGYVTAAQDVASLWLDNKLVVTEKANGRTVDEIYSARTPILKGIPTVVLVNASSASASEIVAGALQDHKAAQLIGMKTFGKGSVQKLISLPNGAQLKVTAAKWYTPSGKNISSEGITPGKVVPIADSDFNAGRDPQLEAAKDLLK